MHKNISPIHSVKLKHWSSEHFEQLKKVYPKTVKVNTACRSCGIGVGCTKSLEAKISLVVWKNSTHPIMLTCFEATCHQKNVEQGTHDHVRMQYICKKLYVTKVVFVGKILYKIGQPRSGVANSWTGCWSWLSCTSFASPFPIGNCRWRRTTIVRGTIGMICGGHSGTRSRCSHRDTICPVYNRKLWLLDTLVCIQSNWSLDWNRR